MLKVARLIEKLFHRTKVGGVTVEKSPLLSSRIWAMIAVPILMMLNKRFELGLTEDEIQQIVLIVGAFIVAKSGEDAWKRGKAMLGGAAEAAPKV